MARMHLLMQALQSSIKDSNAVITHWRVYSSCRAVGCSNQYNFELVENDRKFSALRMPAMLNSTDHAHSPDVRLHSAYIS